MCKLLGSVSAKLIDPYDVLLIFEIFKVRVVKVSESHNPSSFALDLIIHFQPKSPRDRDIASKMQ